MPLHTRVEDGVAMLTFDYPPHNTLDMAAVADVATTLAALPHAAPLVLTGTGPSFCAGVNTRALASYDDSERRRFFHAITRMTAALLGRSAPVVAAVNGHALGGGFVLMLCADYRMATEDTRVKYALSEARAGVPFPDGPARVIRHELPAALLRSLTLTSRSVSVDDLLRFSVIDEVHPGGKLEATASTRARELADQPGYAAVKAQVRGALAAELATLSPRPAGGGQPA